MEDDLELIDYHSWIDNVNNELLSFDCGIKEINDEIRNEVRSIKDKKSKSRAILLVNKKGAVLGFVSYSLENSSMVQAGGQYGNQSVPVLNINLLGINSSDFNKGYGSQLVVAVLRMAKTIDVFIHIDAIQLHSLEDSVDFYKNLGFSEVREYYQGRVKGSKMYYNIESLRDIEFLKIYVNPFLISDVVNN